jgi:ABC-type transport system involved in cytochrome bd biosynthesis fused ATPase/permease subunit
MLLSVRNSKKNDFKLLYVIIVKILSLKIAHITLSFSGFFIYHSSAEYSDIYYEPDLQ